jgi:hypothetical protein
MPIIDDKPNNVNLSLIKCSYSTPNNSCFVQNLKFKSLKMLSTIMSLVLSFRHVLLTPWTLDRPTPSSSVMLDCVEAQSTCIAVVVEYRYSNKWLSHWSVLLKFS